VHSVSRFIESAALVFLLGLFGLGALSYAPSAYASGTLPTGCTLVSGVIVCTDGATGSTGTNCVTVQGSNQQTCLTGGTLTSGLTGSLGRGLGKVTGLPAQTTGTGWLSRITGWFAYAFNAFFTAIAQFFKDLVIYALAAVLSVVVLAISSIPVPDWIANNSMGSLLGQAGPVAGFFMVKLQIPAALLLIGAGYAFRLLRKFLTLFQW
jgi:hypothetical protein